MSAKDDLDRLDGEWENHLRWRKGRTHMGGTAPAGQYRAERGGYGNDLALRLSELPTRVRESFVKDIESIVAAELDARYKSERARLVQLALDEARDTLTKLAGQPVAVEIPNTNTGVRETDHECG